MGRREMNTKQPAVVSSPVVPSPVSLVRGAWALSRGWGMATAGWRVGGGWAAMAAAILAPTAWGGPEGETVVRGDVNIVRDGALTTIQASDRAIINYRSFDIAGHEAVRFVQPDASSRVLNRITSASPTQIDGSLMANGRVYIVNPAGVVFGEGARVNVAGLYAAGGNLSDEDFIRGVDRFTDLRGRITNAGLIDSPFTALVGAATENIGTINAPQGTVVMASGQDVLIGEERGNIFVRVSGDAKAPAGGAAASVSNTGTIRATRGRVSMSASDVIGIAVRQAGRVEAGTTTIAGGTNSGVVSVSGTIDARDQRTRGDGARVGGDVTITGHQVGIMDGRVDASGVSGGGTVAIGGSRMGQGPLPNSDAVFISKDASVRADATGNGRGGDITIWSERSSRVHGSLSARGGEQGGAGGFVETSGRRALSVTATPDVRAPQGRGGNWLIDPTDITIVAGGGNTGITGANPFQPVADPNTATLGADLVRDALLAGATVTVTTTSAGAAPNGGRITVDAAILPDLTGGGTQVSELVLNADADIIVNAAIGGSGNGGDVLGVTLNAGRTITVGAAGSISTVGAGNIALNASNGGGTNLTNAIVLAGNLSAPTGTVTLNAGSGSINQTGGTISATTLTLSGTGASGTATYFLGGVANDVNNINGSFVAGLNFADADDLTVDAALNAGVGEIALIADTLAINATLTANGGITLRPLTASRSIGLGAGAGDFSLTEAELQNLASTGAVTIGNSASGTGLVTIDAIDLSAEAFDLAVFGGSITTANAIAMGTNDLFLTARTTGTGLITIGGTVGAANATYTSDTLTLSALTTVTGTLALQPFTITRTVVLGSAGTASELTISELALQNQISAATLLVGRADAQGLLQINDAAGLDLSLETYAFQGRGANTEVVSAFSLGASVTLSAGTNTAADGFLSVFQAINAGGNAITLNGAGRADSFSIRAVAASNPITINANGGDDLITISAADSTLDAILASVTINGGLGNDSLTIDDSATLTDQSYLVTSALVRRGAGGQPEFSYDTGVESVLLRTGAAVDTVTVSSTSSSTSTTINTGAGNDAVTVSGFANLGGDLSLIGGADAGTGNRDAVTIDDSGETVARTYTLGATTIGRSGVGAVVAIDGTMERVQVGAGTGDDIFNVAGVASTTSVGTFLLGGDGNDTFNIGTTNNLNAILANVSVTGGVGADVLSISDSATATGQSFLVTSALVRRGAGGQPEFGYDAGVETVNLTTGSGNDAVSVTSTRSGATTTVTTGAGNDELTVTDFGNLSGDLSYIAGADAGTGNRDVLTINDSADATGRTYTINATSIARTGTSATLTFDATTEGISATGGSGNDTFNVVGVANTSVTGLFLTGGTGDDVFNIATGNDLAAILRGVQVTGGGQTGDAITINDSASTASRAYTIRGGDVIADTLTIVYATVNSVTLNGSSVASTYDVLATSVATTLNAGAGDDTFTVTDTSQTLTGIAATLTVSGGGDSGGGLRDQLFFDDSGFSTGRTIQLQDNGVNTFVRRVGGPQMNYSGVERLQVTAGAGDDTFSVSEVPAALVNGVVLLGGAGNDTANFGAGTGTLSSLLAGITFNGETDTGSGNRDRAFFFDSTGVTGRTYTLGATTLARSGASTITFVGTEGLTLEAAGGIDTITVNGTPAATTISAGGGADIITINGMANLVGTLTIDGQTDGGSVTIDDTGTTTDLGYTVADATVTRSTGQVVSMSNIGTRTLSLGSGANVLDATALLTGITWNFNLGGGDDTLRLGGASNTAGDLDGILSTIVADGQGGSNSLIFVDVSSVTGRTYTLNGAAVSFGGVAPLTFSGFASRSILAGSGSDAFEFVTAPASSSTVLSGGGGDDTFDIDALPATATLSILGGTGDSLIRLGQNPGSLDGILNSLTVTAGTDTNDEIIIRDSSDLSNNSYEISGSQLNRNGQAILGFFSGVETLTINAGDGNDTFAVFGTGPTTVINGGLGDDAVTLSNGLFNLDDFLGDLTFNGGGNSGSGVRDQLIVTDTGTTTAQTWDLDGNILRRGARTFTRSDVENYTLSLGSGGNTIFVRALAIATQLNTGAGSDSIFIDSNAATAGGNANGLTATLGLNGQGGTNTITVVDVDDTTSNTFTIAADSVGAGVGDTLFGTNGRLSFSGINAVTINRGGETIVNSAAVLGANTTITTTNDALTFGSVSGLFNLTTNSGTAQTGFGTLTGLNTLSATAATILFGGNVSAASIGVTGDSLIDSDLTIAATSALTLTGLVDATGAGGQNLTLNGNTVTVTGNVGSGLRPGNLSINSSGLTTLSGSSILLNGFFLKAGSGATNLAADITTNDQDILFSGGDVSLVTRPAITLSTGGTTTGTTERINFANLLNLNGIDLTLVSDGIDFSGGADSVRGTGVGTLAMRPTTDATSIGIGGGAGTLGLSLADLLALQDGVAALIAIGQSGTGAHAIDIDRAAFRDPVSIRSPLGSIAVRSSVSGTPAIRSTTNGSIALLGPATITISGDIITDGDPFSTTSRLLVTGPVLIATTGGGETTGANISFGGADSDGGADLGALTLDSGTLGDITITGAIGASDRLSALSITRTRNLAAQAVTARRIESTLAGDLTFTGRVTAGVDGLSLTSDTMTFDDGITTIDAGTATLTNGGLVRLRDAVGGSDGTIAVSGNFLQNGTGPVTLGVDLNSSAGTVRFDGATTLDGATRSITTTNANATFGTLLGTSGLTLGLGTGTAAFNGTIGTVGTPLGALSVTSGGVTISQAVHAASVSLVAGLGSVTVNGPITSAGDFTSTGAAFTSAAAGDIQAAGATITHTGAVNVGGDVTTTSGTGISISGDTFVTDGVLSGSTITLTAAGDGTVNNSILSTGTVDLRAATSTVDPRSLTITAPTIQANTLLMRAGDGVGGSTGNAIVINIVPLTILSSSVGGLTSPSTVLFRQDASITDGDMIAGTQFGGGPGGVSLTYISDEGSVGISTGSRVAGSNLTLQGLTGALIEGDIAPASLSLPSGATFAADVTTTNNLTIGAASGVTGVNRTLRSTSGTIFIDNLLAAGATNLTLSANEIEIRNDGTTRFGRLTGTADLTLQPESGGAAINIGGATDSGDFDLSTDELGRIEDGFARIIIGRDGGLHTIATLAPLTFQDSLVLRAPAGSIQVTNALTGTGDASITLTGPTLLAADITTNGQPILVEGGAVVGANVTLDATGGGTVPAGAAIGITGATSADATASDRRLTVNAGAGNASFGGSIGSDAAQRLNRLVVTAANTSVIGAVRTTGLMSFSGNAAIAGPGLFTSIDGATAAGVGSIEVGGTLSSDQAFTVQTAGNAGDTIALRNGFTSVGGPHNLTLSAGANDATVGGTFGTAAFLASSNVVLESDTTVNAGTSATFSGTVTSGSANRSLAIVSPTTTFGQAVGGTTPEAALASLSVAGGPATINGSTLRTVNNAAFAGPVILGSNLSATSTAGGVRFLGGLSSFGPTRTLVINAPGASALAGGASGLTSLTSDAGGTIEISGTIAADSSININDGAILTGGTTLTAPVIAISTLNSATGSAFPLTATASGGSITLGNTGASSPLDSISLTATDISLAGVRTNNAQSYTGSTTLAGILRSLVRGAITFSGPVRVAQDSEVITAGLANDDSVTFSGLVNSASADARSLTVTAGTGAVSFLQQVGGTNALNNLTAQGRAISVGSNVTTTGSQVYSGATGLTGNLASTGVGSVAFDGALTLGQNTTITTNNGAVVFGRALDSDATPRSLVVNTGGSGQTRFVGAVGGTSRLQSLTTNGDGTTRIEGRSVRTVGDQSYGDAVTLANDTRFEGVNIAFTSTVNSDGVATPRAATIDTGSNGVTRFSGTVGGVAPLARIVTNADGSTEILSGASVRNNLDFGDPALVRGTVNAGTDIRYRNTATIAGTHTADAGFRFDQAVRVAGETTLDARGGTIFARSTIDADSSVTDPILRMFSGSVASVESTPIRLGGNIGVNRPLGALVLGPDLSAVPRAATVVMTDAFDDAGNILFANALSTDVLRIVTGSGGFTMGQSQKLTAFGSLRISSAGTAVLGDLTAMTDIQVSASAIQLRLRPAGQVTSITPTGTFGTVTDSGLDFVAADSIDFSVVPTTIGSGPTPLFGTNNGTADPELATFVNIAFVNDIFPNSFRDTRTTRTNFMVPVDFDAQGASIRNIASSLAGAIPRDTETREVATPVTVSQAIKETLNEMGIAIRDELDIDQLLEFLVGRALYQDQPLKPNPSVANRDFRVTINRLSPATAEEAVNAYRDLIIRTETGPDGNPIVINLVEEIADVLADAWDRYESEAEDPTGTGFREWLESRGEAATEEDRQALSYLEKTRVFFSKLDVLGLAPFEADIPKRKLIGEIKPAGMSAEQLREAIVGPEQVAAR